MTTAAMAISELMRGLLTEGEGALARVGEGPYLVEIPTQDPAGRLGEALERHTSSTARTVAFDEGLLLDLKRIRGSSDARVWSLSDGATLGRSSGCRVHLSGEESVSKEHARFVRLDGGWAVVDLGSTNGTFVGRERLPAEQPRPLEELVALQAGSRRFAWVPREDLLALLTPVTSSDAIPLERLRFELTTLGSRRFLLRYTSAFLLISVREEDAAAELRPREAFPLVGRGPLTLGRTSQASITIRRGSVSKWHARLSLHGEDAWSLEDTGSSHGTVVNGRKLEKGAPPVKLAPWDALGFGPSVVGLYLTGRGVLEYLTDSES